MAVSVFAVAAATLAAMVLGFLWYGPLFGKAWRGMMGFTKKDMTAAKKKGMAKKYLAMIVSTFVMGYVLANVVGGIGSVAMGLKVAFWLWLGFIAPVQLGTVLWEGKPVRLYLINTVHYLVSLLVMAAILTVWA